MNSIVLENETLSISIYPEAGGKIHSFYHKNKKFELAAQNEHPGVPEQPNDTSEFGDYAFGMDDTFPNIDEEMIVWNGKTLHYPNHGEIWKKQFDVKMQTSRELLLCWHSEQFQYDYEKHFCLEGNRLIIQYKIVNHGQEFPCLWTWHGLLRYEEDMRFIYAKGIKQMRNVLDSKELGECGKLRPTENDIYDFTKVPSKTSNTMIKYYANEAVTEGVCGVTYPTHQMCCTFRYDESILPYLGVWITAGGLDGAYNCALEPSSGFYDSISTAKKENRLPILHKEETLNFEFSITLDFM